MKLFVAYVQSLDVPFDWRTMCREQDSGYDLVMRETEGSVATIDLERRQTGWSILGAGRPRCAIVSWTPTDAPADAVVLARGRIVGLPNDLLAAVQTITIECGPGDVSDRLLAYCKSELSDGPETDFLFTDADPDDVESYLLGRSGSLHVDPATHQVGYSDDLVGDTVHDLADGFVVSSSQGVFDAPVRRYRAKVVCDWTQEADGRVDVAGRINAGSAIPTLDSGFAGRIASSLSASGADGWSTAGEPETKTFVTETFPQLVGSTYVAIGFNRRLVYLGPDQGGYGIVRADEDAIRSRHDVSPVFQRYDVTVTRFPMSYRYSQDRRDTAYVVLEVPVQDSVVVADRDLETVEWSLGDVFDDATIPVWEQNVDYEVGDVVRYGGRFHECILAHRSAGFDDDTGTVYRRRVPGIEPPYFETTRTHWLRTRPTSIPSRATTTKFLSTARGELCLRHAVLRLRKEGRRRLRAWHVVVEAEWLQAVGVRLTDSVSVLVPWDGEGAHRRAVGKVVGIERQWRGGSAPIVRIELGIPFGMGGSPVGGTGEDAYVEPGYVDEEYLGAVGPTDLVVRIEAENPKVPVRVEQLSSPGYAVLGCTVRNEAADQLLAIGETLEAGADITEISVRKPTSVRIAMRPLEMSSEALEREIDVVADLLVTPAGIDLS